VTTTLCEIAIFVSRISINHFSKNTMKNSIRIVIATLVIAGSISTSMAQLSTVAAPSSEYLFAPQGGSMMSASTGIPYVGITEYAYGISDKTTVGLMFGVTPKLEGYGARIRTIIAEPSENTRIYFRAPIIYYPGRANMGGEPWVLAWPVVNIERELESGTRIWGGVGAMGTCCVHSLLQTFGFKQEAEMMGEGFDGGLWNTVQVGVAKPISQKLVAQAEFGLVMSGIHLAPDSWGGGPPVLIILGVAYNP
jgi:hypothetical protein